MNRKHSGQPGLKKLHKNPFVRIHGFQNRFLGMTLLIVVLVTSVLSNSFYTSSVYAEEEQGVDVTVSPEDAKQSESGESEKEPEKTVTESESDKKEDQKKDQPVKTDNDNRISGLLWLDTWEDKGNQILSGDGIRQEKEQALADYEVSLYRADDKHSPFKTVKTDGEGKYIFEGIDPGTYVVGISSRIKDDVEYLLPLAGMTADNRFAKFSEDHATVFSEPVALDTHTQVSDLNAGIRVLQDIVIRAGSYKVYRDTGNQLVGMYTELKDAVAACQTDGPYTIVTSMDDSALGSAISIPAGKEITLTSDGTTRTLTQTVGSEYGRHFLVSGSLTLRNIVLSGREERANGDRINGGVQVNSGGKLVMEDGAKLTRCYTTQANGGAILVSGGGTFILNGGEISGNETTVNGGGVYLMMNASMTMNGGVISANQSASNGGGIYQLVNASLNMTDGTISGNRANVGGGVFTGVNAVFTMSGGAITGNTAVTDGGGIYSAASSYANPAASNSYANIQIAGSAAVRENTANGGRFLPPSNYLEFTRRAANVFDGLLLDNDNINYRNPYYTVIYKVNNNTGTPDTYQATGVPIGSSGYNYLFTQQQAGFDAAGAVEPGQEKFLGWNTSPDSDGVTYTAGQRVRFLDNLTLYAQWGVNRYVVSKDGSGEIIGSYDQLSSAVTACLTTEPCTIKATADDPMMGSTVTIPSDKEITLTSDDTRRTITQDRQGINTQDTGYIHFQVLGTLRLKNIVLSGKGLTDIGVDRSNGGVQAAGGTLVMEDGAKITKCINSTYGGGVNVNGFGSFTMNGGDIVENVAAKGDGGGVSVRENGSFTMNGGSISNNKTNMYSGGGVNVKESGTFVLNGGTISENKAPFGAGGVIVGGTASFRMEGGVISKNTVDNFGGGVCVWDRASFVMKDGEIFENAVASGNNGGGVYVDARSTFSMSGGSIYKNQAKNGAGVFVQVQGNYAGTLSMSGGVISQNTATSDGGGIYTMNYRYTNPITPAASYYKNITITDSAKVENNTARFGSQAPPGNYQEFTERLSNPFDGLLLDNDNINYHNPNYAVIYHANNGGVGTQKHFQMTDISSGTAVVNAAAIGTGDDEASFSAPPGKVFERWTEYPDGTGNSYMPGAQITFSGTKNLYAKWRDLAVTKVTISKTVEGEYGDRNKLFDFKVTLQDESGAPLSGSFSYTGGVITGSGAVPPQSQTMTLDEAGQATLKLRHGQTIMIDGILENSKVRVAEENITNTGYSTTYKIDGGNTEDGTDSGWLTMTDTNRRVDFTNTHGSVTATGISDGDTTRSIFILAGAALCMAGGGYLRNRRRNKKI